jgi:hypothetical protein
MEALKRKADLSVKDSMTLADGTLIELTAISARKAVEIGNNKRLSDFDKGIHLTAAKVKINGQPVTYDDLLDCFTESELTKIIQFANEDEDESKNG